ncbi:MAG: metallopeptidase TldD-related protein [Oligoflexia bacterium]|nr:metallopeptidase TldD-related protein [Oligoflexia bacterium]
MKKKGATAWIITEEHVHRRERYFMLDRDALVVDQDRDVHSYNIHLKLFVDIGRPGRQGEISKKLFTALPLDEQLDAAIVAAKQTDHQAWSLPLQFPKEVPDIKTSDPRIAEDMENVMAQLTQATGKAVARPRESRFNSAELFLSVHDSELHLSNGLRHRSSQSRIYSEAAYSYSRKKPNGAVESDEYLNTRWAVNLDDLAIDRLFDETADRARHSLDTHKPVTGHYPVIVDADVLATLFNNHLSQLSSANSYHGLPFVKPGDELVKNATGDLLTITLDPSLEYGADTGAFSESGVSQSPFRLVEKNRVIATATDKRYADYLKLPVTATRGNVVVEAGSLSHEELTRQAPKVLEILQFSGLFADPNTGTFSSEIRLAKLYENQDGKNVKTTYVKGGSLSGSFTDNLRAAKLSRNRVKRSHFSANNSRGEGYYGPEHILLSDVSIVG